MAEEDSHLRHETSDVRLQCLHGRHADGLAVSHDPVHHALCGSLVVAQELVQGLQCRSVLPSCGGEWQSASAGPLHL